MPESSYAADQSRVAADESFIENAVVPVESLVTASAPNRQNYGYPSLLIGSILLSFGVTLLFPGLIASHDLKQIGGGALVGLAFRLLMIGASERNSRAI